MEKRRTRRGHGQRNSRAGRYAHQLCREEFPPRPLGPHAPPGEHHAGEKRRRERPRAITRAPNLYDGRCHIHKYGQGLKSHS